VRLEHQAREIAHAGQIVALAGMHEQAVAARVAALERAFLQVDDVVSARVLVDEPDEVRAAAGEAAADRLGW
jgi:enamine deaminase RidA (YjgF/YER057c/UK114 family)